MKFISFFAGIGGIDLGLERAGHECVTQVEIDPYCIKVLEKHWPNVQRFKDITKLTGDELPSAELWAAGFPCQNVSVAGKRAGIDGEKTGLFFDFMRLVRTVRPKLLLLENVPGLLSSGHGRVQGELAEAGYHALWDQLSAADVGALHLRKRWFCVCWKWGEEWPFVAHNMQRLQPAEKEVCSGRNSAGLCGPELAHAERLRESQQEGGVKDERGRAGDKGQNVADTKKVGIQRSGTTGQQEPEAHARSGLSMCSRPGTGTSFWAVEPNVGRVAHGVPRRVDRLRCLGNAVVPQCAEWIGRQLL